MEGLMAHVGSTVLTREQLGVILPPEPTPTFKPIKHGDLVDELLNALARRQLSVVKDEYAVSQDGMRLFGVLDLATSAGDFRFSIGLRNANDKSMRLGLCAGYRVFVCDNMAFHGDFFAIQAKHSKNLVAVDALSLGVDRIQRNFEPLMKQVETWKGNLLTDGEAKSIICDAFIGDQLEVPKHLGKIVYDQYFNPKYPDFEPRNKWSLQNAFTSAFKILDPYPQFKATARLGEFFN